MFFLTIISLFSLIVYLVRFNTNEKRNFTISILTRVSNFTTYDSTTIINGGRKEFQIRQNATIYSIL